MDNWRFPSLTFQWKGGKTASCREHWPEPIWTEDRRVLLDGAYQAFGLLASYSNVSRLLTAANALGIDVEPHGILDMRSRVTIPSTCGAAWMLCDYGTGEIAEGSVVREW